MMRVGVRGRIRQFLFPRPTSFYRGVEIGRCSSDGALINLRHVCPSDGKGSVYEHDCYFQDHRGHQIKAPVSLTWKDKALIWLKIVK